MVMHVYTCWQVSGHWAGPSGVKTERQAVESRSQGGHMGSVQDQTPSAGSLRNMGMAVASGPLTAGWGHESTILSMDVPKRQAIIGKS